MVTLTMLRLSYILRTISLAILSGGCIAVTVSAIALVTAAKAHGVTAAAAATANAPMFITFSSLMLGCAITLFIGELLDLVITKRMTKLVCTRFAASALSVTACFILSFAIVPPMKAMIGEIHTNEQTEATWKTFHESARIIFGIIILTSLTALCVPAFEKRN